jgi:hypothetical protein
MTETEWLTATDPTPMLEFVRCGAGERKLRLLACHCCRAAWPELSDPRSRAAVELAERVAEEGRGEQKSPEYTRIHHASVDATRVYPDRTAPGYFAAHLAVYALDGNLAAHTMLFRALALMALDDPLRALQLRLLADLFGNPFRPVVCDPSWLTSDVRLLARGIYDERAFDRMPILADALQDTGCGSDEVLNHCRRPGEHVRGCWVVDRILGKE